MISYVVIVVAPRIVIVVLDFGWGINLSVCRDPCTENEEHGEPECDSGSTSFVLVSVPPGQQGARARAAPVPKPPDSESGMPSSD